METNEKVMSGEESLRIITSMINKTKTNISQGSFHLLFWGWLIFACSLSEFILWKFSSFTHPYYVWLFVVPGVFVSMIYGFVKGKKSAFHTYADMLYMWTWLGFLVSAVILFVLTAGRMESFGPYILMLAGFPTFLSGIIIRFRPLITGGIAFWVLSLAAHFAGHPYAGLAMPLAVLIGYIIPGYLLKNKSAHDSL